MAKAVIHFTKARVELLRKVAKNPSAVIVRAVYTSTPARLYTDRRKYKKHTSRGVVIPSDQYEWLIGNGFIRESAEANRDIAYAGWSALEGNLDHHLSVHVMTPKGRQFAGKSLRELGL